MRNVLAAMISVPLVAAAAGLLVGPGRATARRALGIAASSGVLVLGAVLVGATADGRTIVLQVGGWPPGVAIPFAVDLFSALMLVVSALMTVVCTGFAIARGEDLDPLFHPLVLVLMFGINGAFMTADLFNMFVFFEVMLIASYVLLTLGRGADQIRGGAVYVTTNLLASTLFVAAVALLYGSAGTVNLAALNEAPRAVPSVGVAGTLLLVAFSVKGALVPLHGWLPASYPVAPPAVTALFSGLLTKVALYAMYRVYSVVFAGDPAVRRFLLVVASVTMVVGVLGAVGQNTIRDILSFHMVSQVGYVLMGLALFGPLGLAAGIFFMLQYIAVKTSLFLSAGAIETFYKTGRLSSLGGVALNHPVLATAFIVAALALSGIPPLSGFVGKFALVRAAFDQTQYGTAAVAIAVSFLTLLSMAKIWSGAFAAKSTGSRTHDIGPAPLPRGTRAALVAPALVLAVGTVALGLWAQGLYELAEQAARGLMDPAGYVEAVLGG